MLIGSFLSACLRALTSIESRNRSPRRTLRNWSAETLEARTLLTTITLANIETTSLNYVENATTAITNTLKVSETGSTEIDQATVQITGNYQTGQDRLLFQNTAQLTGSFDSVSGTLTITGAGTPADYQAALRSVTYFNVQDNPSTLPRTFTFQAGTVPLSNAVTRTATMTAVDDPPLLTGDSGAVNVTEHTVTPVSPGILVSDPDNSTLPSATIQITGNYQIGEDRLVFGNTANIQGSWDESTGTLTLTGVDTVSNYRTALRSVSFLDVEDNPSTVLRTVTFQTTDGQLASNIVSRDLNVIHVNQPPLLSAIETTPLAYTQNTPAVNVTSSLLLADGDSDTLASATVQITGGYSQGADQLKFINTSNIHGSFNASTGTLTLTGTDTVSNYRTALRSVTFFTSGAVANPPTKTISFQANDGTVNGNIVTRNIVESAIPNLSNIETSTLAYTTINANVKVTASLQAQVFDGNNLTGAQVTIVNVQNGDSLSVGTATGIQSSWDPSTGILTFTGSSSAANYQSLLRTVTYNNPSSTPSSLHRQITFQVFEGARASNVVSRDINFASSNDRPELSQIETTPVNYPSGTPPTAITSTLNVFDPGFVNLTGAVIQFVPLTGDYRFGQDLLQFVNTATITGTWTPATGKLTLSGTDTVANYEAAIRSVTYFNPAKIVSPGTRVISIAVENGNFQGAPDSNTVTRSFNVTQS